MSDKDRVNKLLVVICGPTGIGKTPMAIKLATQYHTEIVSADSRQVYKELNIGVGKPSPEEILAVPHHLIGYVSITEPYSVGHFLKDALDVLNKLFERHDLVILTGGTGLYVKALMYGIDEMPEVPQDVTLHWTKVWQEEGVEALINGLEILDPEYLKTVDQSNPMRMIRAISLSSHSGRPFSSFHTNKRVYRPFGILPIVLDLPRDELYSRIDRRVLKMMEDGWMEEAKSLFPSRHVKALQTVGYKELFEVIDGSIILEQAISHIQQATRRYAKRQMTWWRNQGEWIHVDTGDVESIISIINQ